MANSFSIKGNYIDLFQANIFSAEIKVVDGKISSITPLDSVNENQPYLLPGFVDAHVHIESSMLLPSEFARLAVPHGTIGTVSDPHEIGNVLGVEGVIYMLENAQQTPFYCCFGAPSCVPATVFETAGADINEHAVELLLKRTDIYYLTEMMNFPGVLNADKQVLAKIAAAKKYNKPVDGHAPGLKGALAQKYIQAGISTDHECFTLDEALDKLSYGMKILIREGSAAKNFNALVDLLDTHPNEVMFCSDDKHPDSLVEGHINLLVKRALAAGKPLFPVLKAACINPVLHYNLPIGLLRVGDSADFIVVDNLTAFNVMQTIIHGECVAENNKSYLPSIKTAPVNHFNTTPLKLDQLSVKASGTNLTVIEALNGQLITNRLSIPAVIKDNCIQTSTTTDVLKLVCYNRYHPAEPAIAFIKNFGLKRGAIAGTVAHDSHNIIAVGTSDEALLQVINELVQLKGGIAVADEQKVYSLALPVAGLMSNEDGYEVAKAYAALDTKAKELGSTLDAPFMTLSFMALLVIPELKLSDKGLFDGSSFQFTALCS